MKKIYADFIVNGEIIKKSSLPLAARQPVLHRYSAKRSDYQQAFYTYLDEFYND